MQRDAKLAIDGERPQRERAQLGWAVDEVVKIRGSKGPRIRGGMQLRRDFPLRGSVERDSRLTSLQPSCPHQRRRNVQVCMRGVDRQMRSVEKITEHLIADANRTAMRRHTPLRRIRLLDTKRHAGAIIYLHVVHVSRKFMNSVTSG